MEKEESLKKEIFKKIAEYVALKKEKNNLSPLEKNGVCVSGKVYDEKELLNLVDSALEFWLTAGRYSDQFEKKLSEYIGTKYCVLTNSGSSANLLAISALTSPLLKERSLKPGDEIITTACGFPTTLNPIIQNKLIPVFVDIEIGNYNV